MEKYRLPKEPKAFESCKPFLSTRMSLPLPKSSLLKSMSKNELISEVRKQKQEYNKQLK
jgi:hypothetical protein